MIGQPDDQYKTEVCVMGIDASLCGTGICCLKNNELELHFLPETKLRGAERLLSLRNRLCVILDDFKPKLVVLEGYSYESDGRLFEIGEWGGVIKVELYVRNIPLTIATPKQIKKFASGDGSADKKKMIRSVSQRYNIDVDGNDDLADAAAAAKLGEVYLTGNSKYRSELEIVRDLKLPKVKNGPRYKKRRKAL